MPWPTGCHRLIGRDLSSYLNTTHCLKCQNVLSVGFTTSKFNSHSRNRNFFKLVMNKPICWDCLWKDLACGYPSALFRLYCAPNSLQMFHSTPFGSTIVAKYEFHSIYVTFYFYRKHAFKESKWLFRRAINCAAGTWDCSALQKVHFIVAMIQALLCLFMFCVRVRY
jgi:hypothetical protein